MRQIRIWKVKNCIFHYLHGMFVSLFAWVTETTKNSQTYYLLVNITLMIMFRCLRINSFKETIRSPAIKEGVKWVEFELENHRAVRSLNLDQRDNSLITLILSWGLHIQISSPELYSECHTYLSNCPLNQDSCLNV